MPMQALTFSLDAAPGGASISSGGQFNWSTVLAAAPSTNDVTVRVTDSGSPNKSDTKSFKIVIVPKPIIAISNLGGGVISLTVPTIPGHHYQLLYKDNLNLPNWLPLGSPVLATGNSFEFTDNIGANPQRFYLVQPLD